MSRNEAGPRQSSKAVTDHVVMPKQHTVPSMPAQALAQWWTLSLCFLGHLGRNKEGIKSRHLDRSSPIAVILAHKAPWGGQQRLLPGCEEAFLHSRNPARVPWRTGLTNKAKPCSHVTHCFRKPTTTCVSPHLIA